MEQNRIPYPIPTGMKTWINKYFMPCLRRFQVIDGSTMTYI